MRTVCTPSATATVMTFGSRFDLIMLMSPLRSSRALGNALKARHSLAAEILFKVAVGEVGDPHCRLVLVAFSDDDARTALDQFAEAVPAARDCREAGMQRNQGGGGSQGGDERRVAGDGPADDGAQHDAQDDVERRRLAHKASLVETNHGHRGTASGRSWRRLFTGTVS